MAPRAISRSLAKLTRPVLEKRGIHFAALVAGWPDLAGPRLAADTAPERLALPRGGGPGVLHLRVTPALAVEVQHIAPQLIERINAFLCHAAVARLALAQRPPAIALRRPARLKRIPSPAARAAATAAAEPVEDEMLRAALARLGAHLVGSR
jgi:hypothetical protein